MHLEPLLSRWMQLFGEHDFCDDARKGKFSLFVATELCRPCSIQVASTRRKTLNQPPRRCLTWIAQVEVEFEEEREPRLADDATDQTSLRRLLPTGLAAEGQEETADETPDRHTKAEDIRLLNVGIPLLVWPISSQTEIATMDVHTVC